jgi:hypothetical protein
MKIKRKTKIDNGRVVRITIEEVLVKDPVTGVPLVDELIAKQNRMQELLRQLAEAQKAELCQYRIVGDPLVNDPDSWEFDMLNVISYRYFLFRLADGKEMAYGSKAKILSVIKKLGIDRDVIYIDPSVTQFKDLK